MKLFVKVVWVGPNLKWLTDALTAHYLNVKMNRSVVLLSRVPSTVTLWGRGKFVSVAFPPCETLQSSDIVGCKYELQRLVKLVWSQLEIGAKPAYEVKHSVSVGCSVTVPISLDCLRLKFLTSNFLSVYIGVTE
jgi:hypothetical protein